MVRKSLFFMLLFIGIVHFSLGEEIGHYKEIQSQKKEKASADSSKEKKIYFTFRLGAGGSTELGGGGQATLDIRPGKLPIAISILFEEYRRMPLRKYYAEPDDTWFSAINLLYMTHPFRIKRVNIFLGGGIGGLKLWKYERTDDPSWRDEPYAKERGIIYNLEAGINVRAFRKIGFYAVTKYIYAKKKRDGVKVIDLNSTSWHVGITFNFGLF
ncbi:MAG: hypothetical protein WBC02_08260 [Candidatus Aminicenantaceae bacterium]